ncbi:MAG TPA: DUF4382 domain-containing protein [Chitinophagaceae bacterium]
MKKTFVPLAFVILLVSVMAVSCSKADSESTTFKVRLTDNPYNAEEVNVDIREVNVNFHDDSTGWQSLNTNTGIYNLLGLQNGVDTLLATGVIPSGSVKEIRFVLGSDNTIKIDGETYPLTIPSGSQSGLKIKLDKELNGTVDSVLIDFDANLSVHQTGNGTYQLKPVLRVK